MAPGLAAQVPLRLGQPLGAFPELAGGRSSDGAAVCFYRSLLIGEYRTVDVSYASACKVMTIIMCSMVEGYPMKVYAHDSSS